MSDSVDTKFAHAIHAAEDGRPSRLVAYLRSDLPLGLTERKILADFESGAPVRTTTNILDFDFAQALHAADNGNLSPIIAILRSDYELGNNERMEIASLMEQYAERARGD